MPEPRSTIWPLDEHSRGKHLVLKNYLGAWFPIIGSKFGRFLFIDGFAGPGAYEGGEPGSPIVALDTYLDHRHRRLIKGEAVFVFIERREDRAAHLNSLIVARRERIPDTCKVHVEVGSFDDHLTTALDELRAIGRFLAPAFVMIDPFGVSDTPMKVIARILENPQAEVYVSFMADFIERFAGTDEFAPHLDALFGTSDWNAGLHLQGDERRRFFYELYERQLRSSGAKQVVRFELFEGNRLVYAIFFGTKNVLGADRMKEAIWKVDPLGGFEFRGARGGQGTLQLEAADFRPLVDALQSEFRGQGWLPIEQVADFVASDQTDYYTGQLRQRALIPLEEAGQLTVQRRARAQRTRLTYPPGTELTFR
jgi:three-Cys-motif partner protein